VKVKRLGGGFGGKETRSMQFAAACAVAAQKLNRSVRINLDRDIDMLISGTRHPYRGDYKVGVDEQGKIIALDVTMYANAGISLDLSGSVMQRYDITLSQLLMDIDLLHTLTIVTISSISVLQATSAKLTCHLTQRIHFSD